MERKDDIMEHQAPNTAGTLKVSQEVVSTIVKQVIVETEGVQALTALPVSAKEVVLKSGLKRPIKITLNGDVAVVDLSVSLKIGYQVKPVAEAIQNKVKEEIQQMTGITVAAVNVYISDAAVQQ